MLFIEAGASDNGVVVSSESSQTSMMAKPSGEARCRLIQRFTEPMIQQSSEADRDADADADAETERLTEDKLEFGFRADEPESVADGAIT